MNTADRGDSGSASIWLLTCCMVLGLVAGVAFVRGTAVLARHRAESAADLAALAGAIRIGVDGDACGAAGRIAGANGARLTGCRLRTTPDGRAGSVRVTVDVPIHLPFIGAQMITARARAGRVEAGSTVGRTP